MRNAARTVKARTPKPLLVVCYHCGKSLNPRDATKAKPSSRAIIKQAILWALDEGPATPREIEARLGIKPHGCDTANLLRVLERKGEVRLAKAQKTPATRGVPTFLWERVSASDMAARAKQPQTIDRARPNHKDSKRGARS